MVSITFFVKSWFFGNSVGCFWSYVWDDWLDDHPTTLIISSLSRNKFNKSNLGLLGGGFPTLIHSFRRKLCSQERLKWKSLN